MKHLSTVPSGSKVFVDTNIFVFYYLDQGYLTHACYDFLKRTAIGEIQGFTSSLVVAELTHRVIVSEAAEQLGLESKKIVPYLQTHPDVVCRLKQHLNIASDLRQMGINILSLTYQKLHRSKAIRSTFGLMTNDSLIVATMQQHKLVDIATNDTGFARVSRIRVWKPEQNKQHKT